MAFLCETRSPPPAFISSSNQTKYPSHFLPNTHHIFFSFLFFIDMVKVLNIIDTIDTIMILSNTEIAHLLTNGQSSFMSRRNRKHQDWLTHKFTLWWWRTSPEIARSQKIESLIKKVKKATNCQNFVNVCKFVQVAENKNRARFDRRRPAAHQLQVRIIIIIIQETKWLQSFKVSIIDHRREKAGKSNLHHAVLALHDRYFHANCDWC